MMGLGKGDSLLCSHDVWYQFLKISRLLTEFHRKSFIPPELDPIRYAFSVPYENPQVARVGKTLRETLSIGGDEPWIHGGVFAKFWLKLAVNTYTPEI